MKLQKSDLIEKIVSKVKEKKKLIISTLFIFFIILSVIFFYYYQDNQKMKKSLKNILKQEYIWDLKIKKNQRLFIEK